MRSSSNKIFEVFDFKADDEMVESVSGRLVGKFRNTKSENSPPPITEYEFLECVSREVDIQQMQISNVDDQADVISDEDGTVKTSFPLTSSDIGENEGSLEDPISNSNSVGWEMESMNVVVVVSPDYLIYGERSCTESLLTFSCSCIMLEGSNACGNKESFSSEWAIFDVTHIESQWCVTVETAIVKLCVRASAALGADNSYRAPDIVELKFAVYDRHWPQKQEKILLLNARYKAVWEVTMGTGMAREEVDYVGQNGIFSSNRYFSNYDKPFEDVVYPKGDPDAVSISKRDVELLQPETFINDTLIDFYIKYLKNKIQPEDQHRFHFFNSFFFRKLADLDKDPSSAFEGRAAFQRVRKWTRKVNLFEKDYIFIPVNFNLHWSLIVICHVGEVVNLEDEETDDSHKVPCILHMDSIKGSHKGLKNLVQSYLWEEWKERQAESSEDLSSKFLNLRFVPLELPQQENSFDCGLFLLHYVESFLEKAPVNFSPFQITKFSDFLSINWFPPMEASIKRDRIRKLIQELLEDHSLEIPQAACGDVHHSSGFPKNNDEKENGLVFLSERCRLAEMGDSNSSFPTLDQGIEITLLDKSPLRGAQFVRDQGLVFRELFEPGTTVGTFPGGQYQSFDEPAPLHMSRGAMSPIEEKEEEEEEIQEQTAYSPSGAAGCWPPAGLTFEACPTFGGVLEPLCNTDLSMRLEEHNDADSSPQTSSFGSPNAFKLGIDDLPPIRDFASQNQEEESEKASLALAENSRGVRESPASSPSARLETCVVEDSQEMDRMAKVKENEESLSCKENSPAMSHEETYSTEGRNPLGDNAKLSGDESGDSESDEHHHTAKRPRLMLSAEVFVDFHIELFIYHVVNVSSSSISTRFGGLQNRIEGNRLIDTTGSGFCIDAAGVANKKAG
ncbi:Peptidase C48 [Macleaya cordata]|uniref:Peptidase C48 n=1 Tax=Macleaya cordata TaxID=56857 RepID=A0A200QK62_MACCD|nr:Peptidase C48 [Macleaya cordata]